MASANREIIFKDSLKVKKSPHEPVFACYGVHAEEDGLWLMDGNGEWHGPLQETDVNGKLVINSLYQRLKAKEIVAA